MPFCYEACAVALAKQAWAVLPGHWAFGVRVFGCLVFLLRALVCKDVAFCYVVEPKMSS